MSLSLLSVNQVWIFFHNLGRKIILLSTKNWKNEKFGNFSTSYFFLLSEFSHHDHSVSCIILTPHHSDRSPLCPCCPHQSPLGVSLRQTSLSLNENIDLKKPDVFCGAGDRELQLYSIQMSQIFRSESTLK